MHRHAYASVKLSRRSGPRRALLRGLLDSLILYERVETTESKAKALAPYFERQVTRAKAQDLASYRLIMAETINPVAAQKLYFDLAKGFTSRQGGYTRIIKTGTRLGDGAPMAVIELVLDEGYQKPEAQKLETGNQKSDKKPATKPAAQKVVKKAAVKADAAVTTKITTGKKPKKVKEAKK